MNAQAVMKRCVFLHFSVYLQPQSHSLGHGRLGEDSLYVRHELSGQSTAFWTNQITFLLNSRNHSKVEREVGGNDSTDSLLLQLLLTLQVCKEQNPRKKRHLTLTHRWDKCYMHYMCFVHITLFVLDLQPLDHTSRLTQTYLQPRRPLTLIDYIHYHHTDLRPCHSG